MKRYFLDLRLHDKTLLDHEGDLFASENDAFDNARRCGYELIAERVLNQRRIVDEHVILRDRSVVIADLELKALIKKLL